MNPSRYSKTIAAIIAYVLAWAAQVVASAPHAITSAEWLALAGGVAVAAGVYGATNVTPADPPVAAPSAPVVNAITYATPSGGSGTFTTPPQPPPAV